VCEDFDAARWSVGACAERLLGLHESLFGGRLEGFARCPECGAALELGLDISSLRAMVKPVAEMNGVFELGGVTVEYRALTAADLTDAAACVTVAQAHALLLDRAITASHAPDGEVIAPAQLAGDVVERLAQRLAEGDPWAESLLELACPECMYQWTVLLDVAAFLWTALRARAQRLLQEVHALAAAYGWREKDILALSARRRAAYLAMVGA
jgi:hypothetical protein